MTIADIVEKVKITNGLEIIRKDEFTADVYRYGKNVGDITLNSKYVDKKQVYILDGPGYDNLKISEQNLLDVYVQSHKW